MEGNYSGARERPREGRGEMLPVGVAWPRTGAGIFVGANLAVTAAPPALRSSPLAQFATLAFFRLAVSSIGWPGRSRAGARV